MIFKKNIKHITSPLLKLLGIFLLFAYSSLPAQNLFDTLDTSQQANEARESRIQESAQKINELIDQIIDKELFTKSIQARRVRKNNELVDSLERYYDDIGIDFTTYSRLNVDELWANVFNSRKVYSSVQGKYDTTAIDDQYGRSIFLKIQIDSVSSLSDLEIKTNIRFNTQLNEFLTEKNYDASDLESQMNSYLASNINTISAQSPDEYRDPIISAMSWMYLFLKETIDNKDQEELVALKEAEEMASEDFTYAKDNFQVKFLPNPNQIYGFDEFLPDEYAGWQDHYPTATMGENGEEGVYYVAYKSVQRSSSTPDYVDAEFLNAANETITLENITFKTRSGETIFHDPSFYPNQPLKTRLLLKDITTLTRIYAYWGEKKLGKLYVKPFRLIPGSVSIVPVGEWADNDRTAQRNELLNQVKTVFGQAVVNMSVELNDAFTPNDPSLLTAFENPDDEGLAQYTQQMRDLRDEYFKAKGERTSGFIIFVIDGFENPDLGGYMPKGRRMGFVTKAALNNGHTLAHELGHGAYGLEHVWEEGLTKRNTHNLMDYLGSFPSESVTHLTHKQWKAIHNPLPTFSYFDDAEEAASVESRFIFYLKNILIDINKNKDKTDFAFINNTAQYKPVGSGSKTQSKSASMDGQYSNIIRVRGLELEFDEKIDLTTSYVSLDDDNEIIKLKFKKTNGEEYGLIFEFEKSKYLKILSEYLNRPGIITAFETTIKSEINRISEDNSFDVDDILNLTTLCEVSDLKDAPVDEICEILNKTLTASTVSETGDDEEELAMLSLIESIGIDKNTTRINTFFKELQSMKHDVLPLWNALVLDFTEVILSDTKNTEKFFELMLGFWDETSIGKQANTALNNVYTNQPNALKAIASYPLMYSGAPNPEVTETELWDYLEKTYSDGDLEITYTVKQNNHSKRIISANNQLTGKIDPFSSPMIIMTPKTSDKIEIQVVPAFYAHSLERIYSSEIGNVLGKVATRSFIFYVSLISTAGTTSSSNIVALVNLADISSATLGMVNLGIENKVNYGDLSEAEKLEYKGYLKTTQQVINVFDIITLGKAGIDGVAWVGRSQLNAVSKVLTALEAGKITLKSGLRFTKTQLIAKLRIIRDRIEEFLGKGFAEAGGLLSKLDKLGLTKLTNKLDEIGSSSKTKFLDDFAGASDDALRTLNNRIDLVDYWKTNRNFITNKTYPDVGNINWQTTKNIIEEGVNNTDKLILKALEEQILLQPLTNSRPVMAGAYCAELGGDVIIKYNLTTAEKLSFNYTKLEPIIKNKIDYMNLIRQDAVKGGKIYEKLYSGVSKNKLLAAGEAASHAEVLALDALIKEMKKAGIYRTSTDLSKISVLVRGKGTWGNMCRCPHCFHLTDGVNMMGNR